MVMFDHLPVAAVINGRWFCVHGGLSPSIEKIDQINTINRVGEIGPQGAMWLSKKRLRVGRPRQPGRRLRRGRLDVQQGQGHFVRLWRSSDQALPGREQPENGAAGARVRVRRLQGLPLGRLLHAAGQHGLLRPQLHRHLPKPGGSPHHQERRPRVQAVPVHAPPLRPPALPRPLRLHADHPQHQE